ncbi:hypothetical protein HELRODRAFT_170097 [Helobdella robusta]|uniref:Uncharacterized protein n=1 Tax=Helobdella robusta TaxID=6412 RepID=T1F2M2_HELRO|nr:hypothetical protein HELRODRAFT_170097 [Helobdella robusta]ESO07553.1 hypothetical protein HELRODRAFT_170097 [Helobdella robusta]
MVDLRFQLNCQNGLKLYKCHFQLSFKILENKENQYQEEIEKLKHGYDFDYMYNSLPRITQKSQEHQKRQVQQNIPCDTTVNTVQKKCSTSEKPVSKLYEQREQIAVTPNSVTPNKPVRPNSLSRKQLFYSDSQQDTAVSTPQRNKMSTNDNSLHANESSSGSKSASEKNETTSSEVLKLKSELLIKDQHLRKMRTALRELSVRHNELLDLHMQLIKNDKSSSSLSTASYLLSSPSSLSSPMFSSPPSLAGTPADKSSFVHDLTSIVENLQKVIGHVSTAPHKFSDLFPGDGSSGLNSITDFLSPSQSKSSELAKLKMVVQNLKLDVLKRCYSKD